MGVIRKRRGKTNSKVTVPEPASVNNYGREAEADRSFYTWINIVVGLIAMTACGYIHALFMYTLHENNMWFTNIQEVEREISFRTESGLYYSYYKQLVKAPSLWQGIQELTQDRLTEHPDVINVLARMNVYQEVVLAALYRTLPIKEDAILFYIKAIFALHGLLVAALFVMTWLMSRSWFAGILTAAFYSLNRLDTTRVSSVIPLRESFALPFLWVQVAALTYYFKPQASGWPLRISVGIIGGSTFLFCLCWQFNQFILLLQALALVAAFLTHLLPQHKVIHIYSSNNNIDSLDIRQQLMSLCDLAKIMRPANQEFEGGIKQKKLMF